MQNLFFKDTVCMHIKCGGYNLQVLHQHHVCDSHLTENNPYILVTSRYIYDLSVYHILQPKLHWWISYHHKTKVKKTVLCNCHVVSLHSTVTLPLRKLHVCWRFIIQHFRTISQVITVLLLYHKSACPTCCYYSVYEIEKYGIAVPSNYLMFIKHFIRIR